MRILKKVFLICFVLAVIGGALGIYLAIKLDQPYTAAEPSWETALRVAFKPQTFFPGKNNLYVLILGTDNNWTQQDILYTKGTRSDTTMLAHIDLKHKTVKILSIPRDLYVYIPGDCYQGDCYDKINAATSVGGVPLSEKVVASLTGIPIDYYVRIKTTGLINFVNAIGGIYVYVDENMNYVDHWGHLKIHLKKGWQHLNGVQTEELARFRHDPLGDYGRIQRQHRIIKAIMKKLERPSVLIHLYHIVQVAKQSVETNLSFPQILALANLFKGATTDSMKIYTLPTRPKNVKVFGTWVSYVFPDPNRDKKMLAEFQSDAFLPSHPIGVSVEVLNGNGAQGEAKQIADKLQNHGFVISHVGNAPNFNYNQTLIIDHEVHPHKKVKKKILPMLVSKYFPGAQTENDPRPRPRPADLTIVLGKTL
jgi:LCP family protein required for cell wall assembly